MPNSLKEAKKEAAKLKAKLNDANQKFKRVSQKIDRIRGEKEALKKQSRSAQVKADSSTNALKQARKTIAKLTSISDQLRSDRQKYIQETNKNMSKYKSMVSEANTLNRKVEADSKIRKQLEKEIRKNLETEKKLRKEIDQLKAQVNGLVKKAS